MRQPQSESMNKNKIRNYPPVIVSLIVILIFGGVAIAAVGKTAPEAVSHEQVMREPSPTVQTLELHTGITPAFMGAAQDTQTIPTQNKPESVTEQDTEATPVPEAETESTYESMIKSRDWDADESEILLRIAMAEAEGESVEGKALVMLVVLNRVWSDTFPNSIYDVVFQKNQFSVTTSGGRYWTTTPNEECYEALELVYSGWDESLGAFYFESCAGDSWHSRNLEFLFEEGNHKFYK